MSELLAACLMIANLPYTILLVIVVLYWLTVVIGVMDIDIFPELGTGEIDVDVEVGGDLDIGGEADIAGDGEIDIEAGDVQVEGTEIPAASFWGGIPKFLGFGKVPITILASFFILFAWTFSLLFHYLLGSGNSLLAIAFFIPNMILSAMASRIATMPFAAIYNAMRREEFTEEKIEGRTCIILTSRVNENFGQAEVQTHGAPHLLNVRTTSGITMKKGDIGLIIMYDKAADCYLVKPTSSDAQIAGNPESGH